MTPRTVDVVVVGGGPSGSIAALQLARQGREVVLLERAPAWRWRACGVFASPAAVTALTSLGLRGLHLERIARPVPAMAVETRRGTGFRLTYGGTGSLGDSAVGFDRAALDPYLLEVAQAAGVDVHQGVTAARLDLGAPDGMASVESNGGETLRARVVIGADGIRSAVARAAGVTRHAPLGPRAALTFHIPGPALGADARMVVIEDGYVGLAPVPGDRLNVGIVLGRSWFDALRRDGARTVAAGILTGLPNPPIASPEGFEPLDRVAGVTPVSHAVSRRSGRNWLVVGDAAGFLDPFTGEGLHRAIVSAALAAESVEDVLARPGSASLSRYDGAMRANFGTKDVVSRIVQAFLGRPALFEYAARRLAARTGVRETMGLVIGDLAPASRALDPRFLARLLAP